MERFKSNRKIAFNTSSSHLETLETFFKQVFTAEQILKENELTAIKISDGTLLELYTPNAVYPAYLFQNSNALISFRVPDLKISYELALSLKIKPITSITEVCSTLSYCHLQMPDGSIIGLYQEN